MQNEIKEWEKWWWQELNPECEMCVKECKQSSKVEVISCPQFQQQEFYVN